MKDGDLSNLPHKIEGLVTYRRAKITLKYTVFTFWRRYNIHTVGFWILSTDGFQSVHISLIDILVPNPIPNSVPNLVPNSVPNPVPNPVPNSVPNSKDRYPPWRQSLYLPY